MESRSRCMMARLAITASALILSNLCAAQQTASGTIAFYPSGSIAFMQSNSPLGFGGHSISCAQMPIWRDADIQRTPKPMITNTTHFGPCAIDGVLVQDFVLSEFNSGITLTIHLVDSRSFSLLLVNSAGIHLRDLTEVGFKGKYRSNTIVGFNLIGTFQ
jgi:hypothetical protein